MAIQNNNNKYKDLTRVSLGISGVLLGATAIAGGVLVAQPTLADTPSTTKTTDVSVSVSSVCNMEALSSSTAHTAEVTPGLDFQENIGTTDMKATCNDSGGYAIYAIGFSGGSAGNTNLIGTPDTNTIATHTYDASYKSSSYWSMKLIAGTGADAATIVTDTSVTPNVDYSTYVAVPDTYKKVATKSGATTGSSSAAFSTTYGAYAVNSQPAGDYSGNVKYILVHPNTVVAGTYTIAFDANGGTGNMASQTDIANYEDKTIPLRSTGTIDRSGYNFLGWCSNGNSETECTNGDFYTDGGTIPANTIAANSTLTLYAIWQEVPSMQSMTSAKLAELMPNTGDTTTIPDARDGQNYTIAKLADNKYWMVENLNLAGGTALNSDTTDVTSDYISSFSTSNNLTKDGNTIKLPASSTSGFNTNNYSYVYNSGRKTPCTSPGCYSYYSWDAATLGSGRSIAAENTDAQQSICPKNWRLPTSGNSSNNEWKRGDFYALATAYGANLESNYYDNSAATGANFYNNAGPGTTPNFLLAGYYFYGSFVNGGSRGYYWSATSYSNTSRARNLYFNSSTVYSADNGTRGSGFSVRCLFSGS